MGSWADLEAEAPDLAAAGRRRFIGADGVAIGFLATVSALGTPRLAPVCPIFCGDHLYLCIGARTPKAADLRDRGAYALHAFLGENDEELQVSGTATEVSAAAERAAVHRAIPFKSFHADDPLFRLDLERALWVHWERVGEPGTRPIRRRWAARASG
jgi:hypothetical protein